jgi:hypothetical protein
LFPVVGRITQHSGNDTYVISASLVLSIWAYYLVQKRIREVQLSRKVRLAGFLAMILLLPMEMAFSREKASVWSDSLSVFKQAYEVEPSYPNQFSYAETLFFQRQYDKAFLIIQDLHDDYGMNPYLDGLISRLIFESPDFSDQKRIEYFDRYRLKSRVARILRASVEARLGEYPVAYRRMSEAIGEPYSLNVEMLRCDWILQQWTFVCQQSAQKDCDTLKDRLKEKCGASP